MAGRRAKEKREKLERRAPKTNKKEILREICKVEWLW